MTNDIFSSVWDMVILSVKQVFTWFYTVMPPVMIPFLICTLVLSSVISLLIKPIFNIQSFSTKYEGRGKNDKHT